jgi:pyridoxamine 5'-phosphate oxidase
MTDLVLSEAQLVALRKEYQQAVLHEEHAPSSPYELFTQWFSQAIAAGIEEPNAMALATASTTSAPSLRMVLLKGHESDRFVFYTNYLSQKGRELAENPQAAILFFWGSLERQIRIEGVVSQISREESQRYFDTRPRSAKIGARVSQQSAPLADRRNLEQAVAQVEQEGAEEMISKCPEMWGGIPAATA